MPLLVHEELSTDARGHALARLRAFGASLEPTESLASEDGSHARLAAYASRARQRHSQIVLDTPWIALVLEGKKRLDSQGKRLVVAGEAMLLPTRVPMTVTNLPDPDTGFYHALCVEVVADAQALVRRHHPDFDHRFASWFAEEIVVVPAGLASLQAFEHVCETVIAPTSPPRLLHHRLEGLLLSLLVESDRQGATLAPAQARADLVRAVRNLVRAEPEAAIRAEIVARRLGVSEATLRRKLAACGTNLRTLIRDERMALARVLLSDGRSGVGEVALRCGYESAAKFARQYARAFGHSPSEERARSRPAA